MRLRTLALALPVAAPLAAPFAATRPFNLETWPG